MKKFYLTVLISLLPAFLLGSCSPASSGPNTWIDTPPNNSRLPLEQLTIMAHASDSSGVSAIEFFVDGHVIFTVETAGGRLEWSEVMWMPPAFGTYLIGARGISGDGSEGGLVTSRVVISAEAVQVPSDEITTGTPALTITVTNAPNPTVTVTFDQQSPDAQPEPPPAQIQEPPAVDVIEPPTIVIDTTPPTMSYVDADPKTILTEGGGCPAYSRTATVAAAVGDEGGVKKVIAYWKIGNKENGQVNLVLGELGYYAFVGPVYNSGTMEIVVKAWDKAGNSAESKTIKITVQDCIE
jgi:hypothetical protein